VHASPLQPSANRHFATRFQTTGGSTETLGAKFRVAHASAIVKDVERAFSRLSAGTGMGMERANDSLQLSIIQFRTARCGPKLTFAGSPEDRLSSSMQSFFGVVPIEDLRSLGEQFPGGVPDPRRAIA
jgi:hypothetical protein